MFVTRYLVLDLYRRIIRTALSWEAKDISQTKIEKTYIINEARDLFKKNKNLDTENDIRQCLLEGEARLAMAIHYRCPYPRPVNLPPKTLATQKGKANIRRKEKSRYFFMKMGRTPKVVVVGGRCVGKTAILERAILGADILDKPYVPTIEDIYVGHLETERGIKEKICFYDCAGLDNNNRNIPSHYHNIADAYILVYSITDAFSFQMLTDLKKSIDKNKEKKDVVIIVIGNKQDLTKDNNVDLQVVDSWISSEKLKHFDTTVHNRNTLLDPLVYLSSRLFPLQNKSSFPQLPMGRKNKD